MTAYVVAGATGHVGRVVADLLGAKGAFVMIPPDPKAPDLRAPQPSRVRFRGRDRGRKGAPCCLFLSSANAQYSEGTGPVAGLLLADDALHKGRERVLNVASLIIPAHGAIFRPGKVTPR